MAKEPTKPPEWPDPGHHDGGYDPGPAGPYWDLPPEVLAGREETLVEPYAIIEDMEMLFRDLYDDLMDATAKVRSAALKYACRLLVGIFGVVILSLLLIGAVGVVCAVWLFKAMDALELLYWRGQSRHRPRKRL